MSAPLLAVLTLALAASSRLLHGSLAVVADDRELGEEIARAARRYMPGAVQTHAARDAVETGTALHVRKESGGTTGQRWVLTLSSKSARVIRRTLDLREVPSRFDLAEAVAIGLPDMLARLDEQPAAAMPPLRLSMSSPAAPITRPAVAMAARITPITTTPRAMAQPVIAPRQEEAPARREPAVQNTLPAREDRPAAAPSPAPPPPKPVAVEPKVEPKVEPPQAIAAAPAPQKTVPALPVSPSTSMPAAAIGLATGGAVVLLAGIGTGAAAMMTARQIDTPTQMRFDAELDRRGKALNTASIVLDCVGAAALVGGGAWLLAHKFKARREAPKVSLLPAGSGVVLHGSF